MLWIWWCFFYLWIFLFVIAENSTEDAKFFCLFGRKREERRKKNEVMFTHPHIVLKYKCIFIFFFNFFFLICVFPPIFFSFSSTIYFGQRWNEVVGFFPSNKIEKIELDTFRANLYSLLQKNPCIFICSLANSLLFLPFFFFFNFSSFFRSVVSLLFLFYHAFFFVCLFCQADEHIELRWPFPNDKNILYGVCAHSIWIVCNGLCMLWMCGSVFTFCE